MTMTPNALKELRKSARLNQSEFANVMGVTQAAISHYEQGIRPIPSSFSKLAATFAKEQGFDYAHKEDESASPQSKIGLMREAIELLRKIEFNTRK